MSFFKNLFSIKTETKEELMKKFLIVGLGNIGDKYTNTRHNIGFKILDEVAEEHNTTFETEKLGDVASFRFKGRTFILLKPSTFMNLSGKAVKYWMQQEKIPIENILIITDDVNIDFGTIRVKAKGSAGGHNGLKDIQEKLNTQQYARFRFGVGGNYSRGKQVDYVLGEWNKDETSQLIERLPTSAKVITSFGTDGLANTMNNFNGK
ncbi:aminoacyl-tRNA hydrolase [Polaribacter aestuariivivens]|uniref:Peptidyl-tRNA hydrolase n=1 Tax=Polaribacter aestuariivivens TaxID=2304626 RepID=A0A5S3N608_9FLAO|nr:aminoacyl-tRNA hydrolase [Polaribacter aestuariivivens]TMM30637.1 aminoacyl-tRNA hydrolase [Polaribacter aestuariivivens]